MPERDRGLPRRPLTEPPAEAPARGRPPLRLPTRLAPLFTAQFIKFAAVGASGVLVNLGAFSAFLALGVRSSVASALAIQVSILSNFAVNELWTFRGHRTGGSVLGRAARFQLVSLVGAVMQWTVFIAGNVAWLWALDGSAAFDEYFAGAEGITGRLQRSVVEPPDVGVWLYVSQLAGIGVATGWNFLANFYWTWRAHGHPRV